MNEPTMTKPLMLALAEYHASMARTMANRVATARCGNCLQFDFGSKHCAKFAMSPPAEIQRVGCEEYEFDDIPF